MVRGVAIGAGSVRLTRYLYRRPTNPTVSMCPDNLMNTNRYESVHRRLPNKNPIVLGALATASIYSVGVALTVALLIGAMIWLLTRPTATSKELCARPAVATWPRPSVRTPE